MDESAGVCVVAVGRGAGGGDTNATHTQLVDLNKREWCREIFAALGLDVTAAIEVGASGDGGGAAAGSFGRGAGVCRIRF